MKNFTTLFIVLFFPLFSFLNAQCFDLSTFDLQACGGSQIELTLDISGGEAPYTIDWSNNLSQGTATVTEQNGSFNLAVTESSTYVFTVTDNTNCTETTASEVLIWETIITDLIINDDLGCSGSCEGSASLIFLGGVPPYEFLWSDGQNTPDVSGLCPGTYSVQITDAVGCSASGAFFISSPNQLSVQVEDVSAVTCGGSSDGAIDITVNGGTGGYAYFWTGPFGFVSTSQDLVNLKGGLYTLELVDANGCSTGISVEVPEPSPMEIDISGSDLACMDDGFIQINSVQGGSAPFTYSIDGVSSSSQTLFENLIAGTYQVTVTDAANCTTVDAITIGSQITMQLNPTFSNCDSLGGTVTISGLTGTTDASFIWSNGTVGPEISNVAPGGYSVTVTDNVTNCVTHQNVEVLYDPACFVRISGYVLNDVTDQDCVEDPNSIPTNYAVVSLNNGDLTFTDDSGYYEFETSPGTYEVSVDFANSFYEPLCIDPITVTVSDFGDISMDNNFWVTYPDNQDLAITVYAGPVRPGFDQSVVVYARNFGGFPMDGTLSFTHDALQSLVGTLPAASDYDLANTTLTWDFENLQPGSTRSYLIELNLPPGVALGTPIRYTAAIGPEENDIDLTNNVKEINLLVTGSYDPNDKQVTPRGEGEDGNITRADSSLTYQVRFQNTGTDTAFTVVILDKISDKLDITTVRPGPASHPYRLNIMDGNTLEFRFENILLPDSFVNEPASNGFVLFDIKTKKDLPFGTSFENTAEIYFDFNEPIITNTVINTLANPVSVKELAVSIPTQINPNPGGDESVFIYTLEHPTILDLNLYDLNGKLLYNFMSKIQKERGTHQLNLEGTKLPKGVYFLHLETEEGATAIRKWVKM